MLRRDTTSKELFHVLEQLMLLPELSSFRLVGGTALSLLLGHRESVDIDLFTDATYGTTPFTETYNRIKALFPIAEYSDPWRKRTAGDDNLGFHLHIGYSEDNLIKTDILYWDPPFMFPFIEEEGIRMASVEEIATMKLETIRAGGRKKDFWDLSEILDYYPLSHLLQLYERKYFYHEVKEVISGLTNFTRADEMPDPICLRGMHWEVLREEMRQEARKLTV